MKILLLVLGGAWFFFALLFVFALAVVARAKTVSATEAAKTVKPVPDAKPQRPKLRSPIRRPAREPAIVRSAA